ncbi:MAG: phosphatidate cytidylyltransferase [Alphaproteobacteria bacterium]|nr:phosphatidate cytidylyltransferase [Alphaproteobacteria bacterium]
MEKSKIYSFIKRVVTSVILIPAVIWCLYAGYPFVQVLALIAGALLSWEWAQMVPSVRGAFYAVLYTFVVTIAVFIGPYWPYLFTLIVATGLAWFKAKGETRRNLLVLGVPYISIGVGSIMWLYELVGFGLTFWFVLIVWAVDIGGMIIGCSLKGPKLAPKISPNKTWSGLIGGMLFSVVFGSVFCWYVGAGAHLMYYGILAAAIAFVAQMGDLLESKIKRSLNLKDSSNLIPGHGGMFDRIDGMIFAAPFVYVLFRYVLWIM